MTYHHHYNRYSLYLGYIVHLLGLAISGVGIGYSFLYISEHGEGALEYQGWPGKFKYLTFWCQLTLPVYFLLCVINDVLGGNTTDRQTYIHRTKLQTLRDMFHAVWVFPIAIFVVSSFWGIYAIDRELVYPKKLDKIIPVWVNHISHTSPMVLLLLEKIFVNVTYPRMLRGLTGTMSFTVVYISWLLWIAQSQGIWAYPILRVLSPVYRTVFLSVLSVYIGAVYLVGHWLSAELWWGPAHHAKPKKR